MRNTCQVGPGLHALEAEPTQNGTHRLCLIVAILDEKTSTGASPRDALGGNSPDIVSPSGPAARAGRGLETHIALGQMRIACGHVGRIGHYQIKRISAGTAENQSLSAEADPCAQSMRIAPRHGQGVSGTIHRHDLGVGPEQGQRDGNRALPVPRSSTALGAFRESLFCPAQQGLRFPAAVSAPPMDLKAPTAEFAARRYATGSPCARRVTQSAKAALLLGR